MTDLYRRNGGVPAELPQIAYATKGEAYTPPYAPADLAKLGFVLAPAKPSDTATQIAQWGGDAWVMVDRPIVSVPTPQPRTIGKLEFIRLAQTSGGMTDAMLVAAQGNPAFAAFWIKFQMASAVERDDAITSTALAALKAGGYLPNGAPAVIAAWPMA